MNFKPPRLALFPLLAVITLLLASCLATPLDQVDASLVGDWQGESTVRPPISFVPVSDAEAEPEVAVGLDITIHEDARVTGTVGGAELKDCVLKQNRSELGRQLNMASDYIIMDGTLDGEIIPGDEELQKNFTIPFDVVDGHMQGSVMWLKSGKYPYPLLRVDLAHSQ